MLRRRGREDRVAFLLWQCLGHDILDPSYPNGYDIVLPYFFQTKGIDQIVLDFANRGIAGVEFLKNLPKDKELQIGVIDVRTNAIETPQKVAERIRKVIAVVPPDRVTLSTDCGMKPLARMVAKMKLQALANGAAIVRKEVL